MQNQKQNLINIISRCNSKQVRQQWIHELVSKTNIECTENECDSCLILQDCLETYDINMEQCENDCKIDDAERCGGCQYAR